MRTFSYLPKLGLVVLALTLVLSCSKPIPSTRYLALPGASIGLVTIPAGKFITGYDYTTMTGNNEVVSPHVPEFSLSSTEVTYGLWALVYNWAVAEERGRERYSFENKGAPGSPLSRGDYAQPVTGINWRDALVWTNALTEFTNYSQGTTLKPVYYADRQYSKVLRTSLVLASDTPLAPGGVDSPLVKKSADGFRLPSNLEWEKASRWVGSDPTPWAIKGPGNLYWTPFDHASGAGVPSTDPLETSKVAWFLENAEMSTHGVATLQANSLGIHDMSGNVWEWVFDWHPLALKQARVTRGGSWKSEASSVQIGEVSSLSPFSTYDFLGFRIAQGRQ